MILGTEEALQRYRDIRLAQQKALGATDDQFLPHEVLRHFSMDYLWPFRVALSGDQSKVVFELWMNTGGQGVYEGIWTMNGWHREFDMIRLAVVFRNVYYAGHKSFEESGELDHGLRYAMPNVMALMGAGTQVEN